MVLALCSCGSNTSEGAKKYGYDHNDLENMVAFVETTGEKYCTDIEAKVETLIETLGDTFDSYTNNKSKISDLYASSLTMSDELFTALHAVTNDCYRLVAKDISEYKTWNGAMEDIYKAWNNAMKDYYDSWNDGFKDIYETCNDLVKLGYDELPYKEYSKIFSDMYDEYSDAWSDMYDKYSDTWGELYDTYSDVWGEFYDGESDIEDILNNKTSSKDDSQDKKPVDNDDEQESKDDNTDTAVDATSFEALEESINKETEKAITTLFTEYETLSASIANYAEYVANADKVEAFYDKVNTTSAAIATKLYEHSVTYAEKIIKSGMSTDDMYDAFDGLYDCIYEDAADILYDGIYDGILEDIYDDFYSGVLDEKDDGVSYSDWSKARSNEYKMWSNTRSDCYKQWSNMRSDIYEFWSDMRSEMYSDDIECAQKIFNDFMEDVQKMLD